MKKNDRKKCIWLKIVKNFREMLKTRKEEGRRIGGENV